MANASSDFNLQKISTKDLSDNLRATIDFGGNVIIVGRRGSGKTEISKACIKESGCKEVYLNLSVMERPDIGGYPNFFAAQAGKSFVDFLLPSFYQHLMEGHEPVVALLDEVDKAESALWAPLLEFTQFHTINGRALPNLRAIIMTGNLQSEGGARPSLPLLDRAEKYLVEASHHHWLDWASKSGAIHPSVTAYIADHPEDLFGDVDPGDVYADPSPRGWHNSSKILNFGEDRKWSNKIMTNKVAGCIGKKTGIKYAAYFDHYQVLLPIIEKIMKGEEVNGFRNLEQSKQMVACMIVCARLSRIIDEMKPSQKDKPGVARTVANFLKTVDPEMALIAVRSQIGLERVVNSGLDEEPEWDTILRDIAKRVNGN
jgi:hypothetical protein